MKKSACLVIFSTLCLVGCGPLPKSSAGVGDASHLEKSVPSAVFSPQGTSDEVNVQVGAILLQAKHEDKKLSISGARHSMGGQTLVDDGITINMLGVDDLSYDPTKRILTAGAGARWSAIIPFLDERGMSVAVMQSNNDFSIGGSISVNCHGWQQDSEPIASTVEAVTIVTADGKARHCDRKNNRELFSLALGGYGLFGVITEVKIRVVPNVLYRRETRLVERYGYLNAYREMTGPPSAGLAFGRVSVVPDQYFREALLNVYHVEKSPPDRIRKRGFREKLKVKLSRAIFRGGVNRDSGKKLRWRMEIRDAANDNQRWTRNEIMDESSEWFQNRNPQRTEILHEYFIPVGKLDEFFEAAVPILERHAELDLLNITVRNVMPDGDTFLRYARQEVFGLVMLFNQGRSAASDEKMKALTVELTQAALDLHGTYYLPYRLHPTKAQFLQAYPQAVDFARLKRKYDPDERFSNQLWEKYF